MIAVPFFANGEGIFWTLEGFKILAVNLLGLVAIYAWAGIYFLKIFVYIFQHMMSVFRFLECGPFWNDELFQTISNFRKD